MVCLLTFLLSYTYTQAQVMPGMPNTSGVLTCFPDTAGYTRITVGPAGRDYTDLQLAIDAAELGSVLVLDAGATFIGGFSLPDKGEGVEWIVIISSRLDLLPDDETRLDPTGITGDPDFPDQAGAMPKIVTTNSSGIPCIKTQASAHHYRLAGLEITADTTVANSYGLVNLGTSAASQNTVSLVPHHFVIDRCYIHGHDQADIMKYGIRLDCANAAVIDSYIAGFHSVGFDAQAISGINGPGPFKIINNYLEASGENILFGGAAPAIPDLVPSDIEIRGNYFYKPWSWRVGHPEYTGKHWTIKNLFELKTGKRILLDGNIMENCWADLPVGQSGFAIVLTVRTEGGASPQADVSDIRISNNIIRHVGAGISISGSDGIQSNRSSRIMVYNNLFDDINGPTYGDLNIDGPNDGTFLKIGSPQDVIIDHNTIFQTGPITWAYQVTDRFVYTNTISNSYVSDGGYQGIYGPGQSQGNNTIAQYFPDITDANNHFHKNVLIGGNAARYSDFDMNSHNYFPETPAGVMFVDYPGGVNDYHGYALSAASPYVEEGTDHLDLGVDLVGLDAAMSKGRGCDSITASAKLTPGNNLIQALFPNPSRGEIYIQLKKTEHVKYGVCDLTGRLILSAEETGNLIHFETGKFVPGVYLVSVVSTTGRSSHLFTVE